MTFRTFLATLGVLSALLLGCKGDTKSESAPAGETTAPAPTTDTPPATGGDTAAAADPAKVDEAANTALKVMAVVSSSVRGAKGDCARMKQNLTGVMTVAQKWRDQLAGQYADKAVKEGVKAGLAAGKFPELKTNLDDTRSGIKACPDAAPDFEAVLSEIE
ncbi:MAG TPA: hypothetical protein VIG06_03250 [Kofleriaceae bacterium]